MNVTLLITLRGPSHFMQAHVQHKRMSDTDNPRLIAEVDADSDDPTLSIKVESNGTTFESIESDLGLLLSNNKFVETFERPVLSLLVLFQQEYAEAQETTQPTDLGDPELEDLPEPESA